ncbi:MAG: hypothetical protein JW862_15955 [Anaerolineales bacterium]|nr:hypothetical protein [Anaerolineales bacterium]
MNKQTRGRITNLVPIILILVIALAFLFGNPCFWLFGDPLFVEHCWLEVANQTGQAISVTPLKTSGDSYAGVFLYNPSPSAVQAVQQRDLVVKAGEEVTLSFSCEDRISALYVCDADRDCYLYPRPNVRATIRSLESHAPAAPALEGLVQAIPERSYRGLTNALLCGVQVVAILGGLAWLKGVRPHFQPRGDMPIK